MPLTDSVWQKASDRNAFRLVSLRAVRRNDHSVTIFEAIPSQLQDTHTHSLLSSIIAVNDNMEVLPLVMVSGVIVFYLDGSSGTFPESMNNPRHLF